MGHSGPPNPTIGTLAKRIAPDCPVIGAWFDDDSLAGRPRQSGPIM